MTPAQAQSLLASLDALGAQMLALRHQVSALVVPVAPAPRSGSPCGHPDAVLTSTGSGTAWVCGDCP